MSDTAIKVEGISKHYRLGAGPQGRGDFREVVASAARRVGRRVGLWGRPGAGGGGDAAGEPESADHDRQRRELWALRDVSFEVKKGEVVGLIGANGAGKSTLLKILSRITDPTSGEAWFEGRVGSLLEVGTGFHPELTGRENILLSGAILGMTRREVVAKLDEIIEFSEVGRFLDTPVKRYSSGMYVRLGFAVAAHLDPEILIVDEVLAVGDASFQRKCMAKMKDVARQGRTILFVSHNMGSIQNLCHRALVLGGGRVLGEGDPVEAVKLYLKSAAEPGDGAGGGAEIAGRADRRGRGRTRLVDAAVFSEGHADAPGLLIYGKDARVEFEVSEVLPNLACKFTIYSHHNAAVCRFTSLAAAPGDVPAAGGRRFVCRIPDMPLVPGRYRINAAVMAGSVLEDHVENAATFEVEYGALGGRPLTPGQRSGVFLPRHYWTIPSPGGEGGSDGGINGSDA